MSMTTAFRDELKCYLSEMTAEELKIELFDAENAISELGDYRLRLIEEMEARKGKEPI